MEYQQAILDKIEEYKKKKSYSRPDISEKKMIFQTWVLLENASEEKVQKYIFKTGHC